MLSDIQMVKLNVKSGTESLFLFETTLDQSVEEIIKELVTIQNGRLKIERICTGKTILEIVLLGIIECDQVSVFVSRI